MTTASRVAISSFLRSGPIRRKSAPRPARRFLNTCRPARRKWSKSTTRSGPTCANRTHRQTAEGRLLPPFLLLQRDIMASYRNSDPRLPIMPSSPPALVPPKSDWDRPPWNRWAFQHVRELLPTVEVWRGNGPPSLLPQLPMDLGGIEFERSDGVPTTLETFLDDTYTDGFLVLHRGRIVTERYFNGMGERTLHLSQSMAKSVTAAAAGCLVAKGMLDPTSQVTHYLPELGATAYRGATVQQVLDMTS